MQRVVGLALSRYLAAYIKDFSLSQFVDWKLHNLEFKEDVVQSIAGIPPNFTLKRVSCNEISAQIPSLSMLGSDPIVLIASTITLELEEADVIKEVPIEKATTIIKPPPANTSQGMIGRILDNIKFQVKELLVKVTLKGGDSPSSIFNLKIEGIEIKSTNSKFEVVDLKQVYTVNKDGHVIMYKEVQIDKLSFGVQRGSMSFNLFDQVPIRVRTKTKKAYFRGPTINHAINVDFLNEIKLNLRHKEFKTLQAAVDALLTCLGRTPSTSESHTENSAQTTLNSNIELRTESSNSEQTHTSYTSLWSRLTSVVGSYTGYGKTDTTSDQKDLTATTSSDNSNSNSNNNTEDNEEEVEDDDSEFEDAVEEVDLSQVPKDSSPHLLAADDEDINHTAYVLGLSSGTISFYDYVLEEKGIAELSFSNLRCAFVPSITTQRPNLLGHPLSSIPDVDSKILEKVQQMRISIAIESYSMKQINYGPYVHPEYSYLVTRLKESESDKQISSQPVTPTLTLEYAKFPDWIDHTISKKEAIITFDRVAIVADLTPWERLWNFFFEENNGGLLAQYMQENIEQMLEAALNDQVQFSFNLHQPTFLIPPYAGRFVGKPHLASHVLRLHANEFSLSTSRDPPTSIVPFNSNLFTSTQFPTISDSDFYNDNITYANPSKYPRRFHPDDPLVMTERIFNAKIDSMWIEIQEDPHSPPKRLLYPFNMNARAIRREFQDGRTPTWTPQIDGQVQLSDISVAFSPTQYAYMISLFSERLSWDPGRKTDEQRAAERLEKLLEAASSTNIESFSTANIDVPVDEKSLLMRVRVFVPNLKLSLLEEASRIGKPQKKKVTDPDLATSNEISLVNSDSLQNPSTLVELAEMSFKELSYILESSHSISVTKVMSPNFGVFSPVSTNSPFAHLVAPLANFSNQPLLAEPTLLVRMEKSKLALPPINPGDIGKIPPTEVNVILNGIQVSWIYSTLSEVQVFFARGEEVPSHLKEFISQPFLPTSISNTGVKHESILQGNELGSTSHTPPLLSSKENLPHSPNPSPSPSSTSDSQQNHDQTTSMNWRVNLKNSELTVIETPDTPECAPMQIISASVARRGISAFESRIEFDGLCSFDSIMWAENSESHERLSLSDQFKMNVVYTNSRDQNTDIETTSFEMLFDKMELFINRKQLIMLQNILENQLADIRDVGAKRSAEKDESPQEKKPLLKVSLPNTPLHSKSSSQTSSTSSSKKYNQEQSSTVDKSLFIKALRNRFRVSFGKLNVNLRDATGNPFSRLVVHDFVYSTENWSDIYQMLIEGGEIYMTSMGHSLAGSAFKDILKPRVELNPSDMMPTNEQLPHPLFEKEFETDASKSVKRRKKRNTTDDNLIIFEEQDSRPSSAVLTKSESGASVSMSTINGDEEDLTASSFFMINTPPNSNGLFHQATQTDGSLTLDSKTSVPKRRLSYQNLMSSYDDSLSLSGTPNNTISNSRNSTIDGPFKSPPPPPPPPTTIRRKKRSDMFNMDRVDTDPFESPIVLPPGKHFSLRFENVQADFQGRQEDPTAQWRSRWLISIAPLDIVYDSELLKKLQSFFALMEEHKNLRRRYQSFQADLMKVYREQGGILNDIDLEELSQFSLKDEKKPASPGSDQTRLALNIFIDSPRVTVAQLLEEESKSLNKNIFSILEFSIRNVHVYNPANANPRNDNTSRTKIFVNDATSFMKTIELVDENGEVLPYNVDFPTSAPIVPSNTKSPINGINTNDNKQILNGDHHPDASSDSFQVRLHILQSQELVQPVNGSATVEIKPNSATGGAFMYVKAEVDFFAAKISIKRYQLLVELVNNYVLSFFKQAGSSNSSDGSAEYSDPLFDEILSKQQEENSKSSKKTNQMSSELIHKNIEISVKNINLTVISDYMAELDLVYLHFTDVSTFTSVSHDITDSRLSGRLEILINNLNYLIPERFVDDLNFSVHLRSEASKAKSSMPRSGKYYKHKQPSSNSRRFETSHSLNHIVPYNHSSSDLTRSESTSSLIENTHTENLSDNDEVEVEWHTSLDITILDQIKFTLNKELLRHILELHRLYGMVLSETSEKKATSAAHLNFQYILVNRTDCEVRYWQTNTDDIRSLKPGQETYFTFSNPYQLRRLEIELIFWDKINRVFTPEEPGCMSLQVQRTVNNVLIKRNLLVSIQPKGLKRYIELMTLHHVINDTDKPILLRTRHNLPQQTFSNQEEYFPDPTWSPVTEYLISPHTTVPICYADNWSMDFFVSFGDGNWIFSPPFILPNTPQSTTETIRISNESRTDERWLLYTFTREPYQNLTGIMMTTLHFAAPVVIDNLCVFPLEYYFPSMLPRRPRPVANDRGVWFDDEDELADTIAAMLPANSTSYFYFDTMRHRELCCRLAGYSSWSGRIQIDRVQQSSLELYKSLDECMEGEKDDILISVFIYGRHHDMARRLAFNTQFLLVNDTDMLLFVRQHNTIPTTDIAPRQMKPFSWVRGSSKLLSVNMGTTAWTQPINISGNSYQRIEIKVPKMSTPYMFLMESHRLDDYSCVVCWREWLHVRNHTNHDLRLNFGKNSNKDSPNNSMNGLFSEDDPLIDLENGFENYGASDDEITPGQLMNGQRITLSNPLNNSITGPTSLSSEGWVIIPSRSYTTSGLCPQKLGISISKENAYNANENAQNISNITANPNMNLWSHIEIPTDITSNYSMPIYSLKDKKNLVALDIAVHTDEKGLYITITDNQDPPYVITNTTPFKLLLKRRSRMTSGDSHLPRPSIKTPPSSLSSKQLSENPMVEFVPAETFTILPNESLKLFGSVSAQSEDKFEYVMAVLLPDENQNFKPGHARKTSAGGDPSLLTLISPQQSLRQSNNIDRFTTSGLGNKTFSSPQLTTTETEEDSRRVLARLSPISEFPRSSKRKNLIEDAEDSEDMVSLMDGEDSESDSDANELPADTSVLSPRTLSATYHSIRQTTKFPSATLNGEAIVAVSPGENGTSIGDLGHTFSTPNAQHKMFLQLREYFSESAEPWSQPFTLTDGALDFEIEFESDDTYSLNTRDFVGSQNLDDQPNVLIASIHPLGNTREIKISLPFIDHSLSESEEHTDSSTHCLMKVNVFVPVLQVLLLYDDHTPGAVVMIHKAQLEVSQYSNLSHSIYFVIHDAEANLLSNFVEYPVLFGIDKRSLHGASLRMVEFLVEWNLRNDRTFIEYIGLRILPCILQIDSEFVDSYDSILAMLAPLMEAPQSEEENEHTTNSPGQTIEFEEPNLATSSNLSQKQIHILSSKKGPFDPNVSVNRIVSTGQLGIENNGDLGGEYFYSHAADIELTDNNPGAPRNKKKLRQLLSQHTNIQLEQFVYEKVKQKENHLYFGTLEIFPVQITLSIGTNNKHWPVIAEAQLNLNSFSRNSLTESIPSLFSSLGAVYSSLVWAEVYQIIGNLDAIASPLQNMKKLATGLTDFIVLPLEGLALDETPGAYIIGLWHGTVSLVVNFTDLFFTIMFKGFSSLSWLTQVVCLDDEFSSVKASVARQHPTNVIYGLGQGIREFARGIYEGVSGVVTLPYRGAKKYGTLGFLGGVGKALIGIPMKPLGGIFDLISKTFEGLLQTIGRGPLLQQRAATIDALGHMPQEAEIREQLQTWIEQHDQRILILDDARFMRHGRMLERYLVLTSHALYIVNTAKLNYEDYSPKKIPIGMIQDLIVPVTPDTQLMIRLNRNQTLWNQSNFLFIVPDRKHFIIKFASKFGIRPYEVTDLNTFIR